MSRALSKLGIASRTQARKFVLEGKVGVNGRTVRSPDAWIDPRADRISLENRTLRKREPVYIVLHKPAGVVTTRADEAGRKTVYDLLPPGHRWMFPVGRLDMESSGLLILTNDTRFGERVTNPEEKILKTYAVTLDRPLPAAGVQTMANGMRLENGMHLKPAAVQQGASPVEFLFTISEGKNRQIRKMCETFGCRVVRLKRLSIGPIALGDLEEGGTRRLTPGERDALLGRRNERKTRNRCP